MSAHSQDWNRLAPAWDSKMGVSSNRWHRELILPKTLEMLELKAKDSATGEHYHRPLSVISRILKKYSLLIDSIEEPVFAKSDSDEFEWDSIPPAIICRVTKG